MSEIILRLRKPVTFRNKGQLPSEISVPRLQELTLLSNPV